MCIRDRRESGRPSEALVRPGPRAARARMVLGRATRTGGTAGPRPQAAPVVILLDTNALLYLMAGHRRARALVAAGDRLALSPFVVLEVAFLAESGRGRLRTTDAARAARTDPRWVYDEPSLADVITCLLYTSDA